MSYAKLIHDYLDGEKVETPQQEALFNLLASDEELRSEFQRQVKLHTIAQRDMNAITPPAIATDKVFAGLGFAIPSTSGIAQKGFAVNSWNFIKRNSLVILLLLLGLSFATGSYFFNENTELSDKLKLANKEIATLSKYMEENSKTANSMNEIPMSKANSLEINSSNSNVGNNNNSYNLNNAKKSADLQSNVSDLAQYYDKNDNTNIATNSNERNYSTIGINLIDNDAKNYSANDIIIDNNNQRLMIGLNKLIYNDLVDGEVQVDNNYKDIDNTKWRLIIRRLAPMSYSEDNLSAATGFGLNNTSFTLYRKLNNLHSIGVEFGWEQFGQTFISSNESITYTQSQNPMLFFAGANYSFTPVNWFIPYELYPYSNITAGVTPVGPIIRGQTGLNWRVTGNFNLIIGFEYGTLIYNVEDVLYNSNKSGLIIGTKIKF